MSMMSKIRKYRQYRNTMNELSGLTDRELSDIGISRGEIPAIAWRHRNK